jgi:glucosyl-dolichyl phosphate glucuronosyltransferase
MASAIRSLLTNRLWARKQDSTSVPAMGGSDGDRSAAPQRQRDERTQKFSAKNHSVCQELIEATMDITVIVCTFNRCHTLANALDSIAKSMLPDSTTWETLVVDNNSTDQTAETVQNFSCRYPGRFRYVFEPRQGKSYALNTGILESRGATLVFMDDDTTVEPTWLERLTAPLSDSAWSGSGGPVILQWSSSRPRWLRMDTMAAPLVGFDPNREAGEIRETLFGGNMAFRRTMFQKHGVFRTDLGPSPNRETPRQNEDTEFVRRLLAAGECLFYEPLAVVFHPVPINRLRKRYFLGWWFDKGRADILMLGFPPNVKWSLGGVPLSFVRRILHWTARWIIALEPSERFASRLKVQWLLGMIIECRRSSKSVLPAKFG